MRNWRRKVMLPAVLPNKSMEYEEIKAPTATISSEQFYEIRKGG